MALAFTAVDTVTVKPAYGQGFFERLFGGGQKRSRVVPRDSDNRVRRPRRQSAAPAPPPEPTVEKMENARVILVVGDFLAGGLADGLRQAFADAPGVRVVESSNGSSGLVRDDYHNWPAQMATLMEEVDPSIVVVMIGSNDGQEMKVGDTREQPRTDAWIAEYEKRATALANVVRGDGTPLIWVGMPSFRIGSLSSNMLAFNEIYARVAEATGGEFVDIWDGFVDENGAFIATGPDINGQQVRLRSNDGINVTSAGKRKIAFYAEKPLRRLLGDAASPDVAALGPDLPPMVGVNPIHDGSLERTPPIAMTDPALDGSGELLGEEVIFGKLEAEAEPSARDLLVLEGVAPAPQYGRADAFAESAAALDPPPSGDDASAAYGGCAPPRFACF